ncbi:MAG: tetratricopeptide repeat protein, partial [Planctomycetota bacterium]
MVLVDREDADLPTTGETLIFQRRLNGSSINRLVLGLGLLLFSVASAQERPSSSNGNKSPETSDESDEVLAAYSDAANYQTGGALVPAIEAWNSFLKEYPGSSLAPSAAHYLGVCHMQSDPADYANAAKAFSKATQNKKYELREESLANLGLCLFSMSNELPEGDSQREQNFREVGSVYSRLLKEFPKSAFRDRAHFYRGEAAFALGEESQAIKAYNRLLGDPQLRDSPLRCDALYARGVAQEQTGDVDSAARSFGQYLDGCAKESLVDDVRLRLGDLAIASENFDSALEYFDAVGDDASEEDSAYSLLRGAMALSRMGNATAAARRYSTLTESFPDSIYAAEALLSAGRNYYSAGALDESTKAFERVLEQEESDRSPIAAHWLARISLDQAQPTRAVEFANAWVDRSRGEDQIDLMIDLGDALAVVPQKMAESANWYEKAYQADVDGPSAPRALYNAAFSAIQAGDADRVLKLTKTFQDRFKEDELIDDVLFIRAETFLSREQAEPAEAIYDELLTMSPETVEREQRANWVLR